jgi:hypothetical protein
MKNVTISMNEDLYRLTRVEAARAGKSMSRYIADSLRDLHSEQATGGNGRRNARLQALERMAGRPPLHIAVDGRMPTAEERNER